MPVRPKTHSEMLKESSPFKAFYEARELEAKKQYDRKRPNATDRGYNSKWKQARLGYLKRHPLCIDCLAVGKTKEATEVHHSVKHNGNWTIFWDSSLWMALCKSCHSIRTGRGE